MSERIKFRGRVGEDIVVSIDYGPKTFGELPDGTVIQVNDPTDICTVRFGCETCSITAEILREDLYKVVDYMYKDIHEEDSNGNVGIEKGN